MRVGKNMAENIPKQKVPNVKDVGQRFFLDISSIKYKSIGGEKCLASLMDDHSVFLVGLYLN